MAPREIRRLPEAEVVRHWEDLCAAGKHARVIAAGHKACDPSLYLGRDSTWVEVEIPHELYNADWNNGDTTLSSKQVDRSLEYAGRSGRLPPGMAFFKGTRSKRALVTDGNHRAYAAYLRGDPAARFYMPATDWDRFRASLR